MKRVELWLSDAGLSKYTPAFAGMDEQSFLELMMQVRGPLPSCLLFTCSCPVCCAPGLSGHAHSPAPCTIVTHTLPYCIRTLASMA